MESTEKFRYDNYQLAFGIEAGVKYLLAPAYVIAL